MRRRAGSPVTAARYRTVCGTPIGVRRPVGAKHSGLDDAAPGSVESRDAALHGGVEWLRKLCHVVIQGVDVELANLPIQPIAQDETAVPATRNEAVHHDTVARRAHDRLSIGALHGGDAVAARSTGPRSSRAGRSSSFSPRPVSTRSSSPSRIRSTSTGRRARRSARSSSRPRRPSSATRSSGCSSASRSRCSSASS